MFKIVVTARALKDIQKLDKKRRVFIVEKLKVFAKNPGKKARKLSDPRIGSWRLRVGDYRVIFDLDDDKMVILRLGHRREIYR